MQPATWELGCPGTLGPPGEQEHNHTGDQGEEGDGGDVDNKTGDQEGEGQAIIVMMMFLLVAMRRKAMTIMLMSFMLTTCLDSVHLT